MPTARQAALDALLKMDRNLGYSNIVLDNLLKSGELPESEQALCSRLVYGTVERRLTLDYILTKCSTVAIKRMHPVVLEILRLGAYQLMFMEKIPPSAAVNESVKLAKVNRQGHAAGFVNGVLRGVQRRQASLMDMLPEGLDEPEGLEGQAIRCSCPSVLIRMWRDAYGCETALRLLEGINDVPDAYIRVNTLAATASAFETLLTQADIPFRTHPELPACIAVKAPSLLKTLAHTRKNWYYHQDTASQYACKALSPRPGERIADVCAAPGGKSFTCAQWMENRGELLCCDVYASKCEEMDRRARELGISIISTAVRDAAAPIPGPLKERFDRVICDVPCSGLGVIRRKPEIRYKPLDTFRELPELQYTILQRSAELVRPGGVLQYSTCTLNPAENEQVTERFLQEHREFTPRMLPLKSCFTAAGCEPSHRITLFPHLHHTDGFYIAGFCKNGVNT